MNITRGMQFTVLFPHISASFAFIRTQETNLIKCGLNLAKLLNWKLILHVSSQRGYYLLLVGTLESYNREKSTV